MFIKLTRFDNRPVWLNASFVVTVEPRRDGKGAVVVPIGDGLDYDVREAPEEVLRMLDGAPVPTVVPVPVSDCLTQTPADVSPEPERSREPDPRREQMRRDHRPEHQRPQPQQPKPQPQQPKPVEVVRESTPAPAAESAPAPAAGPVAAEAEPKPAVSVEEAVAEEVKVEESAAVAKPKKRATRTRKTTKKAKASAGEQPAEVPADAPAPADIPADIPIEAPAPVPVVPPAAPRAELELSETDVIRLRKLAPKSLAKLKNTLATQFRIADVGANVTALAEKGVLTIDGNRVLWTLEPVEPS